jgi:hypothetical protein
MNNSKEWEMHKLIIIKTIKMKQMMKMKRLMQTNKVKKFKNSKMASTRIIL